MKTFTYKKYKKCYFIVSTYLQPKNPIAIMIYNDKEGPISDCTTYIRGLSYKSLAVIKNYSENSKMTDFLQQLGIIKEIKCRFACNSFPETLSSLQTDNPQTMDVCEINIDKLKEYSMLWDYDENA